MIKSNYYIGPDPYDKKMKLWIEVTAFGGMVNFIRTSYDRLIRDAKDDAKL